jgi:hypothetical protein
MELQKGVGFMDYTELISLNAFEVALKKAWLEHPELRLDEPCQREDVWEILDHAFHPTIDARTASGSCSGSSSRHPG